VLNPSVGVVGCGMQMKALFAVGVDPPYTPRHTTKLSTQSWFTYDFMDSSGDLASRIQTYIRACELAWCICLQQASQVHADCCSRDSKTTAFAFFTKSAVLILVSPSAHVARMLRSEALFLLALA